MTFFEKHFRIYPFYVPFFANSLQKKTQRITGSHDQGI
jgi:hypothetical protein